MNDEETHAGVAIIGYGFAVRHFANPCAAIGRSTLVKGVPFTIVGVTAKNFDGVANERTDVWIPFQVRPELNAWANPRAPMLTRTGGAFC